MVGFGRVAAACGLVACAGVALGATTSTVVDLPYGVGTQRYLIVSPDAPIANVLVLPGADGFLNLQPDGSIPNAFLTNCAVMLRNRQRFADRNIALTFANTIAADVPSIATHLRTRNGAPVWILGGSAATGTVGYWGSALPPEPKVGVIFFSTNGTLPAGQAATFARPVLLVYHPGDTGNTTALIHQQLVNAPVRELVPLAGGVDGTCGGFHLFEGQDEAFVSAVAGFVERNNGLLLATRPGDVVEYFHAGFGHYFMTAQADEIGGLDGGAFGGAFKRTGRGFRSLEQPAAGTVPVCRFFTVTFAPKSSHFYTADAAECEAVKLNPDWQYEKIAFHVRVPAGGVCAAGTVPVYRMYNNGQTGAPNHRFTTDAALYQSFTTTQNWSGEGIAFCAQP